MTRWIGPVGYGTAVALVVAALLHLGIVLTLPLRSHGGAWSRLGTMTSSTATNTISDVAGKAQRPFQDPAMADAACLYDLRKGPVSASLDVAAVSFAALSVQGRHGRVLYGLTSRSATQNRLTLIILTSAQAAQRPARPTAGGLPDIQVVTDEPDGFVIAEVLARTPGEQPSAAATAAGLACRILAPS